MSITMAIKFSKSLTDIPECIQEAQALQERQSPNDIACTGNHAMSP